MRWICPPTQRLPAPKGTIVAASPKKNTPQLFGTGLAESSRLLSGPSEVSSAAPPVEFVAGGQ